MTTLEIVLAVACACLAIAFVVTLDAAKRSQKAVESLQQSFDMMHGLFQEASAMVRRYQTRDSERKERA